MVAKDLMFVCLHRQTTETLALNVMISRSASFRRKGSAALINGRSASVQKTPGFETLTSKCLTCLTPETVTV